MVPHLKIATKTWRGESRLITIRRTVLRLNADRTVREGPADIAERAGADFPRRIRMCFDRKGARFKRVRLCANKTEKQKSCFFINDAGNRSSFEIWILNGCHTIFQNISYELSKFHFRISYQFGEISAENRHTFFWPTL